MKYLDENGLLYLVQKIKTWLNGKANSSHTHTKSEITDYTDYTLPTASSSVKGGIKVGAGLEMNGDILSATGGGVADSVDWSNVQNKPSNVSEFANDAGYLTQHQDISGKVDKVTGMGLSEESFTTTEKNKLSGIGAGAQANIIEKVKVNGVEVTPTSKAVDVIVPTNNNQLSNGAGYQTASDVQSAISTSLSSVMNYKGTVANYASLPSNANVGDTYNITASSTHNKAGDNAVWNGTSWDVLSGTIDLSGYVETTDLVAITNAEIDTICA